jgi:hypothetical protein
MSIETVIHRIANDSVFAHAMAEDPDAALEGHGLELPTDEVDALKHILNASPDSILSVVFTDQSSEWFVAPFKGVAKDPSKRSEEQARDEIG